MSRRRSETIHWACPYLDDAITAMKNNDLRAAIRYTDHARKVAKDLRDALGNEEDLVKEQADQIEQLKHELEAATAYAASLEAQLRSILSPVAASEALAYADVPIGQQNPV